MTNETIGEQILKQALLAPHKQLKENSGQEIVSNENIIDPYLVEVASLQNSVSAASLFITTIGVIIDEVKPDKQNA